MKMFHAMFNSELEKSTFFVICTFFAIFLKLICDYLFNIFKKNHLGELKLFCDTYKLNALTDNVAIMQLTPQELRPKTYEICIQRLNCVDKLNDLYMRNQKIAFELLQNFNPFSSKSRVELNFDGFMQAEQFIQTDSLEILQRLKDKIESEINKCPNSLKNPHS